MRGISEEAFRVMIEDLNRNMIERWNAGDLEGFLGHYTPEACYLAQDCGLVTGREAILELYRESFPQDVEMGSLSEEILETRFPVHDSDEPVYTAAVVIRWDTTSAKDKEKFLAGGHTMLVLELVGEELCIAMSVDV